MMARIRLGPPYLRTKPNGEHCARLSHESWGMDAYSRFVSSKVHDCPIPI